MWNEVLHSVLLYLSVCFLSHSMEDVSNLDEEKLNSKSSLAQSIGKGDFVIQILTAVPT